MRYVRASVDFMSYISDKDRSLLPNDGVDKSKTDLLFYELLENCSVFQSHGYETCLTGILMVKAYCQCEFTGKSLFCKDNQNYNGIRLLQFSEASELDIVNTFNCCDGFYTRILNDQSSAIDYVLMSKGLSTNVSSVLIDEKGVLDLNSDHHQC